MTILRVQHTIQHESQVPEDAVTNVFHFTTALATVPPADLTYIVEGIKDFFMTFGTAGQAVDTILSNQMSTQNRKIRIYDLAAPRPRPVIREATYNVTQQGSGSFPHEVAMVLSFRADPAPGVLQRRRRGRIYLGPLSDQTLYASRTLGDVRPTALARGIVADAALRLKARDLGSSWCTYSTVDGGVGVGLKGFIDDAYDTQRRRGTKATTRTTW